MREQFKRIKHGFLYKIKPIYLVFESTDTVKSFSIDYKIHAINLRVPNEGRLHIVTNG